MLKDAATPPDESFMLTAAMGHVEHVPKTLGRAKFDVYEGDVLFRRTEGGVFVPEARPVFSSGWAENLIVTAGKNLILDRLFALSGPPAGISAVGVGDDSTAASAGQTQLNPSVVGNVLIQTADAGTSRTAQTVSIQSTFGTGVGNFNWQEAGLFNGTVNGTSVMLDRLVIGPFNKTSAVSIVLQFQITQN